MKLTVLQKTVEKPLENWSNKDFLLYFSQKLKALTGQGLEIPPAAWQGFLSRMVGFRNKLKLSNQVYYQFIDKVFEYFTSNPDYIPTFGIIVSEKVYFTVSRYTKQAQVPVLSNQDFLEFRNQLYSNIMLFRKNNLVYIV